MRCAALWMAAGVLCPGALPAQERSTSADLLALLPSAPDLWIEVADFDRLDDDLAETRLAHLAELLGESVSASDLVLQLALPSDLPEELIERSPSDARALLRMLSTQLGMPESQAGALVESLAGDLMIAALPVAEKGPLGHESLVLAFGLRAGGSTALVDLVLESVARRFPAKELVEPTREGEESRASWHWSLPGPIGSGHLVVRPGLAAWCFDRELALELAGASASELGARSIELAGKRAASRAQDEFLFVHLQGQRLQSIARGSDVRVLQDALGLEGLRSFEVGLSASDGDLHSRLRFERRPSESRPAPAGDSPWSSLDVLPADCPVVLGVRASPWKLGRALATLAGAWGADRESSTQARLAQTPFFSSFDAREALAEESLIFVRTVGPGVPMVYLATPSTAHVDRSFAQLTERGHREILLGAELRLVRKRIGSQAAWVVFDDQSSGRRSLFSITPCAGTWVLSEVSAQLHSLLRQRERERLSEREGQLELLKGALHANVVRSGNKHEQVYAFLHVRSSRISEWAWPYARLALQLTGAVEDPEELPDSFEIAELLGDTTTVVYDLEEAVEVRGSGLLGGLALFL